MSQVIIAIIGRQNVGKSALFNCLTKTRAALVSTLLGTTRDRQYAEINLQNSSCIAIDTAGIGQEDPRLDQLIFQQTLMAIHEASCILFVVDAQHGLTNEDQKITTMLRKADKPIILVVNKIDGLNQERIWIEFQSLGFKNIILTSAAHNYGITALTEMIHKYLPPINQTLQLIHDNELNQIASLPNKTENPTPNIQSRKTYSTLDPNLTKNKIHISFIGKPNAGKSTIINTILKAPRLLVYDMPGTTRNCITIPFTIGKQDFVLIDTPGIRRFSKITQKIEQLAVVKTRKIIKASHVTVLIIDAIEGITKQDQRLLKLILDSKCSYVIAVNKVDLISKEEQIKLEKTLSKELRFAANAKIRYVSALMNQGIKALFQDITQTYQHATKTFSTHLLNTSLIEFTSAVPPPLINKRKIALKYVHMISTNPPHLMIHGNRLDCLPESYKRYLMTAFIKTLKIIGSQIEIEYKNSINPYKDKTNTLSKRQVIKRKRLMQYVKKSR